MENCSGNSVFASHSSFDGPEGDITSILKKLEAITAGVLNARHLLDDKGDQVFGALPTSGSAQSSVEAPLGGISKIQDRLAGLSSEVENLNHAARRFERL